MLLQRFNRSPDTPRPRPLAVPTQHPSLLQRLGEAACYATEWTRNAYHYCLRSARSSTFEADLANPSEGLPQPSLPLRPPQPPALPTSHRQSPAHAPHVEAGGSARATLQVATNDTTHSLQVEPTLFDPHPYLRLALKAMNSNGGCHASVVKRPVCHAQILLSGLQQPDRAVARIQHLGAELLQRGVEAIGDENLPLGFFPCVSVRRLGRDALVVSLFAEGDGHLKLVHKIARGAGPLVLRAAEAAKHPGLIVGIAQRDVLRIHSKVESALLTNMLSGSPAPSAGETLQWMSCPAANDSVEDPTAVTNEAVFRGLRLASRHQGLDGEVLERDAREHAARWGSCEPLVQWRQQSNSLQGRLHLPTSVLNHGVSLPAAHRSKEETLHALGALALATGLAEQLALGQHRSLLRRVAMLAIAPPKLGVRVTTPPPRVRSGKDESGVRAIVRPPQVARGDS